MRAVTAAARLTENRHTLTHEHWIFGYGSLIWRPDFAFLERRRATIRGWRRRFWQASPDHRGVPEAPGRVVTLVREAGAVCQGMAFLPEPAVLRDTMAALDLREQNGYELVPLELEFDDGDRSNGVTYIAGPDNPSFVGPDELGAMVRQIASAHGPSGSNREYVLKLADALDELGIEDDEVRRLEIALRVTEPHAGREAGGEAL